jgi:hypothetical protein
MCGRVARCIASAPRGSGAASTRSGNERSPPNTLRIHAVCELGFRAKAAKHARTSSACEMQLKLVAVPGLQFSLITSSTRCAINMICIFYKYGIGRVGRFLPVCRLRFVFSVCRLVSRRCHIISTFHQLAPAPLRTVLALLTHTAPQIVIRTLIEQVHSHARSR